MKADNTEARLRQLAQGYAQRMGERLLDENAALPGHILAYDTTALDRRVSAALSRKKRLRRRWMGVAALAACLALVFALGLPRGNEMAQGGPSDPPPAGSVSMSAIPLGFELPDSFQVEAVEVDRGQSIYTLNNTLLDPVVLTLEREAPALDTTRMTAIYIGDQMAYARSTADFSLLAFDRGDVRYQMTCRYDLDTLLRLSEHII